MKSAKVAPPLSEAAELDAGAFANMSRLPIAPTCAPAPVGAFGICAACWKSAKSSPSSDACPAALGCSASSAGASAARGESSMPRRSAVAPLPFPCARATCPSRASMPAAPMAASVPAVSKSPKLSCVSCRWPGPLLPPPAPGAGSGGTDIGSAVSSAKLPCDSEPIQPGPCTALPEGGGACAPRRSEGDWCAPPALAEPLWPCARPPAAVDATAPVAAPMLGGSAAPKSGVAPSPNASLRDARTAWRGTAHGSAHAASGGGSAPVHCGQEQVVARAGGARGAGRDRPGAARRTIQIQRRHRQPRFPARRHFRP